MTALSSMTLTEPGKLPESFSALQSAASAALEGVMLPTRKTEDWKYSARRLGDFGALRQADTKTSAIANPALALDSFKISISNGQVFTSGDSPEGLSVKRFSELNEEEVAHIAEGAIAQSDSLSFAQLNQSNLADGVYISVAPKTTLTQVIQLDIALSGPGLAHPRVFLLLGQQAEATVIESLLFENLGDSASPGVINAVVDIEQQNASRLRYIRMDMDQQLGSKSLAATGVNLKRDAFFESHCLGLGSDMSRHDLKVRMVEPGAECSLNGVTVTKDKQHYDNHTCIEHIAAHCESNESYRCIADDQSQIVFNGRIHIHRDAQKTLGAMSNKNLLLSTGAEINSKPELEIYADDVKCAHGTTIGQLEEEEVYYLQTRGITEQQARQMLTLGFVLELVRANPIESVAEYWEQTLSALLSFEDI